MFAAETLERWRAEEEVRIETSAGPDAPVHRTIIWIVVDPAGRALVRSVRGEEARWYREATATGRGAILSGTQGVPVRFERAGDEERIAACSAELIRKYTGVHGLEPMLEERTLKTTTELRPDEG